MTSEHWLKIQYLFEAASKYETSDRGAFLSKACEGDEDLKREIQLLLDKDSGTTVLDRPAWEVLSKSSVKQLAEGTRSSHYRNDVRSFPNESRMKSPRAPWWMYVIAASFIGLQAFIPYLYIWGPADIQDLQARFEAYGASDAGSFTESIRASTPSGTRTCPSRASSSQQ